MVVENASKDDNAVSTLIAVSSSDGTSPLRVWANPSTHRLLVDGSGTTGAVHTEVPTGVVDGSNTSFTFVHTPAVIVVDQGRTMMNGSGWTLSGLVATLDVAPTVEIFSIY